MSQVTLKPLSQALIAAFARVGVHIGPASAPDIIASTFGFWTGKLSRDYKTPYVVAPATTLTPIPPSHLHLARIIDRLKSVAKVDEWKAQELAAVTQNTVREFALRIDTQAIFFDTDFAGDRSSILKAMHDPDFSPVQASVAIGTGDLPLPPLRLDEHLALLGPERTSGASLAENVARYATFLWQKPPRGHRNTDSAFADRVEYRGKTAVSAEFGLGFCLVHAMPRFREPDAVDFYVVAPMLHYSPHLQGWYPGGVQPFAFAGPNGFSRSEHSLPDLIGASVSSLPRVAVCPECMGITTQIGNGTQHECDGDGPDARRLIAILHKRFDSGQTTFTTTELRADVPPRRLARGTPGKGLVDEADLDAFLHTHRATLKIRIFEGTWTLVRKPPIDLEQRAAEATATSSGA